MQSNKVKISQKEFDEIYEIENSTDIDNPEAIEAYNNKLINKFLTSYLHILDVVSFRNQRLKNKSRPSEARLVERA